MATEIKIESAKKVVTCDSNKKQNGHLIELFKDGNKTVVYLTTIKKGAFKGYHLHRIRAARYVCIKGKIKIILYNKSKREEFILDSTDPKRLYIPPNVATGLLNIGNEECWIINYPNPPYDPSLKDEQVEYTQEELGRGVTK